MRQRASAGYTLVELLLVVAILSIVAVVAIPSSSPVDAFRVDAAAGEVALALRHARDEAKRTGRPHLLDCQRPLNRIAVHLVETDKDTSSKATTPVIDPASGAAYALSPDTSPALSQMTIASCVFAFADNTSATGVVFDAAGNPVRGIGRGPARTAALRSGTVVVGTGNAGRRILLDTSGRITTDQNF